MDMNNSALASGALASEQLSIPARDDVLSCLETGLSFLRGETSDTAQKLAKRVLANIIIEHLDISGYVIGKKSAEPEPQMPYGRSNGLASPSED